MRLRQAQRQQTRQLTLTQHTRRAFTFAGRRYYAHDERWGCDLDLLREGGLPDRPRILELGCGPGVLLRVCAALFPGYRQIVGVDYASSICRIARTEVAGLPRISIVRSDITDFLGDCRPVSFDIVLLLNNTLGNCWFEGDVRVGQVELLSRLGRALAPGGLAMVSVYVSEGIGLGRYGRDLQLVEDLGGGSYVGRVQRGGRSELFFDHLFARQEFGELLNAAGLSVVHEVVRGRRLISVCRRNLV